jgi:putative RecB family exonuclease
MEDLTASLPERLSPSRASTFVQCPRKFYYETIEKMRSPNTVATTKGTLAHYACEHIFDHAREERSVEAAVPYVRQHWAELAATEEYAVIVEMGPATVETMLREAEQAVANWFKMETPSKFDPTAREEWVLGEIGECKMRGIIDRVDVVQGPESQRVFISDYKGGKVVQPPYLDKAFFAMNIYVELLAQQDSLTADQLRLIYIKNGERSDIKTQDVTDASRAKTVEEIGGIWSRITGAAKSGEFPPKTGPLCNHCHFQSICPAFAGRIF